MNHFCDQDEKTTLIKMHSGINQTFSQIDNEFQFVLYKLKTKNWVHYRDQH